MMTLDRKQLCQNYELMTLFKNGRPKTARPQGLSKFFRPSPSLSAELQSFLMTLTVLCHLFSERVVKLLPTGKPESPGPHLPMAGMRVVADTQPGEDLHQPPATRGPAALLTRPHSAASAGPASWHNTPELHAGRLALLLPRTQAGDKP